MESLVTKRSVVIDGRDTSVSLEQAFWNGLKEIASERELTLSGLIEEIKVDRVTGNLSSAIRIFVLDYYRLKIGSTIGKPNIPPVEGAATGSKSQDKGR
jgi:predicted DNA-binding ribbon-helix-helix protein